MAHAGGRPVLFNKPEELQEKIDKYFKYCEENKKNPCIAGLAYYIGVDRQTVYNYSEKEKFFGTIKRARDYIMYKLEEDLVEGKSNPTGKIFIAKNYGYDDKQLIDQNIKGSLEMNVDESQIDEKINKLLELRKNDTAD